MKAPFDKGLGGVMCKPGVSPMKRSELRTQPDPPFRVSPESRTTSHQYRRCQTYTPKRPTNSRVLVSDAGQDKAAHSRQPLTYNHSSLTRLWHAYPLTAAPHAILPVGRYYASP